MHMSQPLARVREQCRNAIRHTWSVRFHPTAFRDLVHTVGFDSLHHAPLPTPPLHFNPHSVRRRPGREHPHCVVPGQVSSSRHHFLALHRHRPAHHSDSRPDPARVGSFPFQPYRNSRPTRVVPIDSGHAVQLVHHHVHVPIVVQIRQAHSVRHAFISKSPFLPHFLKAQPAHVPVQRLRLGTSGIHQEFLGNLILAVRAIGLDAGIGIQILSVEEVSGGHQDVLKPIQVDIQKDRRPRPSGGFQADEMRQLGVSAITATEMEGIPIELRTHACRLEITGFGHDSRAENHALTMSSIQHIRDEEIVVTVAIQVADIDGHREGWGGAQGHGVERSKVTRAVIDPDSIGALEIVADVKVRTAVAIEIAEQSGLAPVARGASEGDPEFIAEDPVGPGDRLKPGVAEIQVQHVRFAVLQDPAVGSVFQTIAILGKNGASAIQIEHIEAGAANRR